MESKPRMTTFQDLGLIEPLLRAVAAEGYETPTPIQVQAIPTLLAGGDLLGIAQTGTGKTAAFTLPLLQRLAENHQRPQPRGTRVLILTPTRELASQIGDSFATYGRHLGFKRTIIYGGVGQGPQVRSMARGTDILIATPGRLLDLMQQGHVKLGGAEAFVLDEADRMLDMGFVNDVRKIAATMPASRQTLLFSATMPQAIGQLADSLLKEYQRVEIAPAATTVERIEQRVLFVTRENKRPLLSALLKEQGVGRAIVFTRTKHGADRVAEQLQKAGINADAIHGNKSQGQRQRTLSRFRDGRVSALIATDIAARGIDVDGVTHVINFELPNEPESYVHRIGRTARAGAEGIAISLCDFDEVLYLRTIERTIRQPVPVDASHPYHAAAIAERHQKLNNSGNRGKSSKAGGPKGGAKREDGKPSQRRRRFRPAKAA
jgi:ATP-dependent RNA helicase RhlE